MHADTLEKIRDSVLAQPQRKAVAAKEDRDLADGIVRAVLQTVDFCKTLKIKCDWEIQAEVLVEANWEEFSNDFRPHDYVNDAVAGALKGAT